MQSPIHGADLEYIPRGPIKQQSAPSLPRWIRHLLDCRAHLFAIQRSTRSTEDIATYRKVRKQCKKEIRAHQKSIQVRVLMVARQNKSFFFKYMRRSKKNKPSAPLLKLNEIPMREAILVANGFRTSFRFRVHRLVRWTSPLCFLHVSMTLLSVTSPLGSLTLRNW